jgi:AcrR family transcriptional regulator
LAAATLFSQRGFSGTTTREVAHAVGVSEATVFKYFATKEELYAAIIEAKARTQELLDTAIPLADRKDDTGLLRVMAREMVARTKADPTLMRLLFFSALEGHALSDMFFSSQIQTVHSFLSRYIATRVAAGAFRPLDPIQAAFNFMGMVSYHVLLRELFHQNPPPHLTTERAIDEMVATFLRGVQA